METSKLADSKTTPVPGVSKEEKLPSPWLPVYFIRSIVRGNSCIIRSSILYPIIGLGIVNFAGVSRVAQLGDVELFTNSRSRVSVSSIIAIASILLFGPMAGA
jgi:hypothetical protein